METESTGCQGKQAMENRMRDPRVLSSRALTDRPNPIINRQPSIINSRAFTLIELLVVIAILAMLMALLFPALQGVRKRANAVVCQARLREAGLVLALYAQENNGILPHYYGSAVDPTQITSRPPFDNNPKLALCPASRCPGAGRSRRTLPKSALETTRSDTHGPSPSFTGAAMA